jgi:hypothetical protein
MRQAGHDRHGHRVTALIVVLWIAHRFAGEATPDPMTPAGKSDAWVSRCA